MNRLPVFLGLALMMTACSTSEDTPPADAAFTQGPDALLQGEVMASTC